MNMTFNVLKIIHILSVISWMAGLLYLPRLFVYHADPKITEETYSTFKIMEKRLYNIICNIAAILTWASGLLLLSYVGVQQWIILKVIFVIGLTVYHLFCGKWILNFANHKNTHSAKFFRFINEVPFLILIFIVILVVIKP
ncbi:MAG: TIGR00701 family protein [Pelagibacteraceae bacterium]|nr:TIGR00701 family protein [Pelagibacteraceae bacterium]